MAIKKSVTTVQGFIASDAYHRVEAIRLLGKDKIEFHVRSYLEVSKPFFSDSIVSCAYDIDGENPLKQAYIYLKSTDEFANAQDC
jgi:hypothetical protein